MSLQEPMVALITGVTVQDVAYMAELLLDKGYEVRGIQRRASVFNTDRIDHVYQNPHVEHQRFKPHHGDFTDSTNLIRIIQQVQPGEIHDLSAMSHVAVSFGTAKYAADADGIGTLRVLEAIRIPGQKSACRSRLGRWSPPTPTPTPTPRGAARQLGPGRRLPGL